MSTIIDNTLLWLVNSEYIICLAAIPILDQNVQCLVTTYFIYYTYTDLNLSQLSLTLLSLALITLITCFVLNLRSKT